MLFLRLFYALAQVVFVMAVRPLHQSGESFSIAFVSADNDIPVAGATATTAATSVSPGGAMENVNANVNVNANANNNNWSWSWSGNSKKMFDNILKTSPFFVRSKVESRMVNEIKKRKLSVVTEADLYKVVKTVTPRLFLGGTLKAMETA